jgi:hypothetical protein
MRRGFLGVRLFALLVVVAEAAWAQQEPKPKDVPDAPVAKQEAAPQKNGNPFNSTIELLGRRSIIFPEIATDPNALTVKKKFTLFVDQSIAPFHFVTSAAGAGIDQARNALPDYGQGMSGYGKRFGSSLATTTSSSFFGTFIFSSIMRDDPRYFASLHGGFGHRVGYALSRIVVTRKDDGRPGVNWPGILGPLAAETLANSYLPVKEQTGARTLQRYGIRIGLTTASNALREYWPTIFRSLRITKIAPGLDSSPPATPGATRPTP